MENKPGSKEEDLEKMKKIWRRRMQEMENSGEEETELEEDGECRNSSLKDSVPRGFFIPHQLITTCNSILRDSSSTLNLSFRVSKC